MEKHSIGEWIALKPVVVMVAVDGSKRHGYMSVQDRKHKRKGKDDGSGKGGHSVDAQFIANEIVGPGKNEKQRNGHHPVDEADSLIIAFAKLGGGQGFGLLIFD